jgi:chondroitin AC lyase
MTYFHNKPIPHLCIIFCWLILSSSFAQVSEFELIRERVVNQLMANPVDDKEVKSILERMQNDGSFKNINYSDLSRTAGFPHRRHTAALVTLAKAYRFENSQFFNSSKLLDKISLSTKFWVDKDYVGDNWHNNQISTPTNLVNLMLLVGDKLSESLVAKAQPIIGRAHMDASGARPSGDRIVIAGILAKNLLFIEDKAAFDDVIKIIANEIKFSNGKRGIQQDYSFHHRKDRVNNTTSYGYGKYANAFGEWSAYVAGTSYAFEKERIDQLVDYYLDGIYKQLVYGIYQDISVKNRSIANKSSFQPKGTLEIERLLKSTDYRKAELEEIIQLRKGEITPSRSFAKFFWQTEHFVVQRPDYYTTVRMYSTRNRNMEKPYNGPGITTHHRADGTNYLMLKGDEYQDIWPVYDWQMISGTTIMQKPNLPGGNAIQKAGLTSFVGAVENGQNGAVGFDFVSPHDGTKAKKSWFFFDKSYVCLGAGISASKDLPVFTTIDQVRLRSPVTILPSGKEVKQLPQGKHTINGLKWLYHGNVGYVFPAERMVHISNKTESGRWSDITEQKSASRKEIFEDVLKIWFDHGVRPENENYAYMVYPSASKGEFQSMYETGNHLKILSNDVNLQAVKDEEKEEVQAVFYQPGALTLENGLQLHMDHPGIIMLQLKKGKVKSFAIADPGRKLSAITFTLDGLYKTREKDLQAIRNRKAKTTQFRVQMPAGAFAGKSISFTL